jgi:hypothetical protein
VPQRRVAAEVTADADKVVLVAAGAKQQHVQPAALGPTTCSNAHITG